MANLFISFDGHRNVDETDYPVWAQSDVFDDRPRRFIIRRVKNLWRDGFQKVVNASCNRNRN